MKPVKMGVVGAGGMGRYHAAVLKKVDGVELVGFHDVNPEASGKAVAEFGGRVFETVHQLYAFGVDACIVATPPQVHRDHVVELTEAGVHILCEKPISITLEEADEMIRAARKNHVTLMVGQVLRFWEPHPTVKQMLIEGVVGKPIRLETNYASAYNPSPAPVSGWREDIGGLLENGVHKLDLALWLCGTVVKVKCEVGRLHEGWHEDYVVATMNFENRCIGVLNWGAFLGARSDTSTMVDGTKGSLIARMDENTIDLRQLGEQGWKRVIPYKRDPYLEQLTHFIQCVRTGRKPIVTGVDGRRAIQLGYAMLLSMKTDKAVKLPLKKTPTSPFYD